mmetsp:Transcript_1106/g.4125  ORF Transcript_1106/g.4125 Transcript_1106/m.4125 type:complete len:292 (+) Transcript_1106:4717-5592(+)
MSKLTESRAARARTISSDTSVEAAAAAPDAAMRSLERSSSASTSLSRSKLSTSFHKTLMRCGNPSDFPSRSWRASSLRLDARRSTRRCMKSLRTERPRHSDWSVTTLRWMVGMDSSAERLRSEMSERESLDAMSCTRRTLPPPLSPGEPPAKSVRELLSSGDASVIAEPSQDNVPSTNVCTDHVVGSTMTATACQLPLVRRAGPTMLSLPACDSGTRKHPSWSITMSARSLAPTSAGRTRRREKTPLEGKESKRASITRLHAPAAVCVAVLPAGSSVTVLGGNCCNRVSRN